MTSASVIPAGCGRGPTMKPLLLLRDAPRRDLECETEQPARHRLAVIEFDGKYERLARELIEFAASNGWRTKPVTQEDLGAAQ